jgi:hypothetical protein
MTYTRTNHQGTEALATAEPCSTEASVVGAIARAATRPTEVTILGDDDEPVELRLYGVDGDGAHRLVDRGPARTAVDRGHRPRSAPLMGQTVTCCRWCGADLAPTGGRPRLWCGPGCRDAYTAAFGSAAYDGAVVLSEACTVPGCGLDGQVTVLDGPVLWPGAHATAARLVAIALHGHDVTVAAGPTALSGGQPQLTTNPHLRLAHA